jgi:two-component system, OmpR family, phosphate regulon response regulator PhoB
MRLTWFKSLFNWVNLVNEKILVVEDEPAIRELIAVTLRHAGYSPILTAETIEATRVINANIPSLIILDWMLPHTSGLEFLRSLRASPTTRTIPVLMLTARADEGDRLMGFDAGTDDYLTKPFSTRELIARVKAVLRRVDPSTDEAVLSLGDLQLDPSTHRAFAGSQELKLGPIEFRLLSFFLRNPERVFSREQLLARVWNDSDSVEPRTVDVQIRRLRQALEDSGNDQMLETVRGAGYRMSVVIKN